MVKPATIEDSQKRFARLLALPGMVVLVFLVVGPLLYMFFNSFLSKTLAAPIPPHFVWFRNYLDLFTDGRFWNAFLNSMIIMGVGIPIQAVLGLSIALLLNKKFPGSKIVIALFLIPVMITPVVAGFEWKIILDNRFGPLNFLLGLFKIQPIAWLAKPTSAMISILLMDTWQWTPFVTIVLLAGLAAIPKQIYEASSVDGSSASETLWRMTMPLLRPMFTLVILANNIHIQDIRPRANSHGGRTRRRDGDLERPDLHDRVQEFQCWNVGCDRGDPACHNHHNSQDFHRESDEPKRR